MTDVKKNLNLKNLDKLFVEREVNIMCNKNRFHTGDIVYWCHNYGNGIYSVKYGMVDEQYSDAVVIDYLTPKDRRLINGIPINEFKSEEKRRKLPKDWTYNTPLYSLTYSDLTSKEIDFLLDIKKPETIKEAYNKGYLVKDNTVFHGNIETDITKEGFRIVKKYPRDMHHIDHVSLYPWKVYRSYEKALQEVNDLKKEFMRQTLLTDYEWSVEQIDKTLDRWKAQNDESEENLSKIKNFILSMENVESIETRLFNCNVEWKYEDKKRWNTIDPNLCQ